MAKCEVCKKEYDVDDLVRRQGNVLWKHYYCSARCYTEGTVGKPKIISGHRLQAEKLMIKYMHELATAAGITWVPEVNDEETKELVNSIIEAGTSITIYPATCACSAATLISQPQDCSLISNSGDCWTTH